MTDARLTAAFRDLRSQGLFARRNFWCCQGCGWAAIEADPKARAKHDAKGAVFYHQQDAQDLTSTGRVFLAWAGDGNAIVNTMVRHGLGVKWDGSPHTRIEVIVREEVTQ